MRSGKPVVAVVGLGAIGAMTMLTLAQRGVNVIGIDRCVPGHDDAAYGGRTRQVRLAGKGAHAAEHVVWVRESLRLWRRLESDSKERLYHPTGNLSVGPADDPDIAGVARSLESEGLKHEIFSDREVRTRFPQHRLEHDEIAVFAADAGVLRSNHAVETAVRLAQTLGARVIHNRVTRVDAIGDDVTIRMTGDQLVVDQVVVAGGPWTGELVPSLRDRVTPRVIPSVWVEPSNGMTFDPSNFPPGVRRSRAGHSYTFLPAVGGTAAKFVHWDPMRPTVEFEADVDRTVADPIVAATRESLSHTLFGAGGTVKESRSYVEGFTQDRWPLIGKTDDRIAVLTGFSGGGFGIAPVMAEIAADLALEDATKWDLRSVSLSREFASPGRDASQASRSAETPHL